MSEFRAPSSKNTYRGKVSATRTDASSVQSPTRTAQRPTQSAELMVARAPPHTPHRDGNNLRQWTLHYAPPHTVELGVSRVNVLMLGGAGSGKSTFINAAITALEHDNDIHYRAPVGVGDGEDASPTTLQFERYDVTPSIVLWDSWAWPRNSDRITAFEQMLDGKMPSQWPMTKALTVDDQSVAASPARNARSAPLDSGSALSSGSVVDGGAYDDDDLCCRMHACLILVPATAVLDTNGYMAEARRLVEAVRRRGIQPTVLLSKCDRIDAQVADEPLRAYSSESVHTARATCAAMLSVPLNTVLPLKTYYDEFQRSESIDALVLSALRAALNNANDWMRRRYNQRFQSHPSTQAHRAEHTIELANMAANDASSLLWRWFLRGVEPLNRFRRARLRELRHWREMLRRDNYSFPRSGTDVVTRMRYNLRYLMSNYLVLVLSAILLFSVYHVVQVPWMLPALIFIGICWYWAFRVRPGPIHIGRFVMSRGVKRVVFAGALLFAATLSFAEFGPTVAWTLAATLPIIVLHSIVYHRAIHGQNSAKKQIV